MADQPTTPTANLTWNSPRDAAVLVNGVDLARETMTATLHLDADGIPKLTLELAVHQVDANVASCDVEIGPNTRALLERALWAPPDVARQLLHRADELQGRVAALTGGCQAAHYPAAAPWVTRHDDGRLELHWPEGLDLALVTGEAMQGMVDTHNRALLQRARADALEHQAAATALQLAELRGTVEWLRGLLGEALNRWAAAAELDPDETARTRARTRITQIRQTKGTS